MKKTALALLLFLHYTLLPAQQQSQPELPAYQRFPTIPPFKLLKVDSLTYVTRDDLPKHHLTMIMMFSPECDHCKHQTEDLIKSMDKLKDVEIVMATFQPMEEMKAFYKNFHIADYPNIRMGRDEKYVLPPFYKISSLPYLALYDKKGNLITTFEGNQQVDKLLHAFGKN